MENGSQRQAREQQARASQSGAGFTPRYDTTFSAAAPAAAPEATTAPPRGPSSWKLALAAAGAIAVAVTTLVVNRPPGDVSGDPALSVQQISDRLQSFQARGPLRLPAVAVAERTQAVDSMLLPPAEREALLRDIEAQKIRLVWMALWDDMVEDNDVVEIQTPGFTRVVALTKAGQRITVPVPIGSAITVRGMRDGGGGGITVAAQTESGHVPLPVMTPGQVVTVAVAAP